MICYGDVQGVGFPYTALHTASRYGVCGWVRNLDDGSVEIEAEGIPEYIDSMIDSLGKNTWGYIERTDSTEIPLQDESSFRIRYHSNPLPTKSSTYFHKNCIRIMSSERKKVRMNGGMKDKYGNILFCILLT